MLSEYYSVSARNPLFSFWRWADGAGPSEYGHERWLLESTYTKTTTHRISIHPGSLLPSPKPAFAWNTPKRSLDGMKLGHRGTQHFTMATATACGLWEGCFGFPSHTWHRLGGEGNYCCQNVKRIKLVRTVHQQAKCMFRGKHADEGLYPVSGDGVPWI